jgi:hypothetical protein
VSRTESALEAARTAVKGEDKDAMVSAGDELQKAAHAIAEALYKTTAPSPGPQQGGSDVKDGEVVDAEFAETR